MRNKKTIGAAVVSILALVFFAQISQFAQETPETKSVEQPQDIIFRGYPRDLEGSWSADLTIRNCQTGAEITTFPTMNTFMHNGTMQHDSASVAPTTRNSGHGVWRHEAGRTFSFAFQFFRFNTDGTYAGRTIGRRQAELNQSGSYYSATVTIELYNPAGVLVGTGCATETATRFE